MKRIKIGMVVFPGFQLLDIAGPRDAFSEVKIISKGECEYEMVTVGTTRGSVVSSSGFNTAPDRTIFDECPDFDTVIVPGGLGIFDAYEDAALTDWLGRQYRNCRRICAICNGLFALGSAGLLDNRVVTTHWMDVPRLTATFPRAKVEPDYIYVHDERVYTTAGVTAGIDLSLALIEEDFGRQIAIDVAKYLVVYLRRSGGQSQYSPLLEAQASGMTQSAELQTYILDNLHLEHTVETLARHANMSPRNFSRRFLKECGTTPINFLSNARIDAARRYLESTDLSLREISRMCGFEDSEAFRRAFSRRLQINPADYRERFRTANSSHDASASENTRNKETTSPLRRASVGAYNP